MSSYLEGNIVKLTASFTDEDGDAADPTTVVLKIRKPDGTLEEDITPTNDAVGSYSYTYTPATVGKYYYRFEGTGAIVAADDGDFRVSKSKVT